jgi:TctA family transporter
MRWDWAGWGVGIMGAIVSGGAQGLLAFSIRIPWGKALTLFGGAVAISLGKYLNSHSEPDQLQAALDTASRESAKSVAQAGKAASAVQDAKDAAQEGHSEG